MPLLRLTQKIEGEDQYRIELSLDDDDGSRQITNVTFEYKFTPEDRADMRWYLEDYLQYPLDPAPEIAARVEKRMEVMGAELFNAIFEGNAKAIRFWAKVEDRLDDTRVEIVTDVFGAAALPWELLRDPQTDAPLALRAKDFVRAHFSAAKKAEQAEQADKVRILLVICRPRGDEDVPFRSVAGKLINGLDEKAREAFELDVLRPPTFEELSRVLQNAKNRGEPYHIVHFDGHGGYLDYEKDKPSGLLQRLIPLMLSGPRDGSHGFLFFEHPTPEKTEENFQLVDGPTLGKLLVEADVPVLVLNACRSAHADIQEKPETSEDDVHSQVRAFGSLAQEVMDTGVAGVVAMRYNVYVVTAAQFVADLYASLASGQTLGEAVSMGRKQLDAQPLREIAFDPRPLQDWSVPVVYEAAPISLFPKSADAGTVPLHIDITQTSKPADDLPRPDVGFYGRDETLLALDRAFDKHQVVLLHAYAGSGKTMTAAEFARWYSQTGGLPMAGAGTAPILFTSFEQYKPLERVLDTIGQVFGPTLEASGIQWLALSDEERLNVTAQVLKQIPVLWIWDNVEPINGFPTGTDSAWSEKEQRDLKNFLSNMSALTKAKFLLTSRRDEKAWLGELPAWVNLPPMPMQECVQLARALADKLGKKMTAVEDWKPLLRFTQGNPLTITVVVGQALRDGIETKKQVYEYLNKLQKGEQVFEDETSEGREKSLGASLDYGFKETFNDDEHKILALLHFYQGFVDTDILGLMLSDEDWGLDFKGYDKDKCNTLLDRAAEIGLLSTHGGGYFTIHPALPWFFRELFEQYYPAETEDQRATRAFVEAMGTLGNYYHNQYGEGNREVIAPLRAEEANLLHAYNLALSGLRGSKSDIDWSDPITSAMQGLRALYEHTGRRTEWQRLVDEIVPDFVEADTGMPRSGLESQWLFISQWMRFLFMEQRNYPAAENQIRKEIEFNRRNAAPLLSRPPESLSASEKNSLRTLAVSIEQLGHIQREQGKPECAETYKDSIPLYQQVQATTNEAIAAFNLGHAYKNLPTLRDLDEAERWYQNSLELFAADDSLARSKTVDQIGLVIHEKFYEARKKDAPSDELLKLANDAARAYQKSIDLAPSDAYNKLGLSHQHMANILSDVGDFERAMPNYNEAIRYFELEDNQYEAGGTRYNVAILLAQNSRLTDALLYARAALRNYESYGGRAGEDEEKTKRLIAHIEAELAKGD